jgi:hypothetical protein
MMIRANVELTRGLLVRNYLMIGHLNKIEENLARDCALIDMKESIQ